MSTPAPPSPHRGWLLDTSPFRSSPAYFRFWISGVFGGIGSQLAAVAIGIHLYTLSGSTAPLAIAGALVLGPMLLAGVLGGAIIDAYDRRRVLIIASSISFLAPVTITLLAWNNVTALWPYYCAMVLSGTVGTIVGATRFAIHPRLVPQDQLAAAAGLSGLSAGLQAALGPALAGILVASFGFAWTYTIDVLLFLVGFCGIVSLPPIPPSSESRVDRAALVDGLRFLRAAKNLRVAIVLHLSSYAFGRSSAILPAIGAVLIGGGAATVGWLASSAAIGIIVSGLLSGRLTRIQQHGRALVASSIATALLLLVFAGLLGALDVADRTVSERAPDPVALLACCAVLVVAGMADNATGIFRTTMMQAATPDELRGRLQGLFTLVLTAGPRLGDVFAGTLAAIGALWYPPLFGGIIILAIIAACVRLRPAFVNYDGRNPTP